MAKPNPRKEASWILVENLDTLYKFEYMLQEMKNVLSMIKLKIDTENKEYKVINELHEVQIKKLEDFKFPHEFQQGDTKFNWTIAYSKAVQVKYYEDEKLFESKKGVEIGIQLNDKSGEKKKLRRFENFKNAGYEVDPCINSRREIKIVKEEDKDFIEQKESNVTEEDIIRMISSSLKNPLVKNKSNKNNHKLTVQAPRNKIGDI